MGATDEQKEHLASILHAWTYIAEILLAAGIGDEPLAGLLANAKQAATVRADWTADARQAKRDAVYSGALTDEMLNPDFVLEARRRWITPVVGLSDAE